MVKNESQLMYSELLLFQLMLIEPPAKQYLPPSGFKLTAFYIFPLGSHAFFFFFLKRTRRTQVQLYILTLHILLKVNQTILELKN